MGYSLNQATVIGNVGGDAEVRYTGAGEPVVSFRVATTERWKDKKTSEDRESTEWFSVTAFGPLAKIAQVIVKKGQRVFVQGAFKTDEWNDKEGVKRRSTKIVLSGPRAVLITFDKKESEAKPVAAADQLEGGPFQASDDDIPF